MKKERKICEKERRMKKGRKKERTVKKGRKKIEKRKEERKRERKVKKERKEREKEEKSRKEREKKEWPHHHVAVIENTKNNLLIQRNILKTNLLLNPSKTAEKSLYYSPGVLTVKHFTVVINFVL